MQRLSLCNNRTNKWNTGLKEIIFKEIEINIICTIVKMESYFVKGIIVDIV